MVDFGLIDNDALSGTIKPITTWKRPSIFIHVSFKTVIWLRSTGGTTVASPVWSPGHSPRLQDTPNTSRPKDKGKRKEQEQKQKLETRKKRVGTQKVRGLEEHSGDVTDKQRQKQVQSTGTLENTSLLIYSSQQTSCWHKLNMVAWKVLQLIQPASHLTHVQMCVLYNFHPYLFLQVFNLPSLDLCLVFKVPNSLQKLREIRLFFPSKEANWDSWG